jgi:prepilin-type processing-associated H-X9-DG protein
MLVVIVIIGILAGLMLPAVGKVRMKGFDVRCKNHLKQLHTGMVGHAQDHGHYTHSKSFRDEFDRIHYAWVHWVGSGEDDDDTYYYRGDEAKQNIKNGTLWGRFAGQMDIYACPLHLKQDPDSDQNFQGSDQIYRSYAMSSGVSWANVLAMRNATQRIMFGEVTESRLGNLVDGSHFSSTNDLAYRHEGRANVVYCDGHLESPREP